MVRETANEIPIAPRMGRVNTVEVRLTWILVAAAIALVLHLEVLTYDRRGAGLRV
jgi:hypothetical protein